MTLSPDSEFRNLIGRKDRLIGPQVRRANMATVGTDQGYGIKCEPDMSFQSDYYPPPSHLPQDPSHGGDLDMDLTGFLEMDDRALSELTNGVPSTTEWSSLFNGQLDGLDSLDPTTGIHSSMTDHSPPAQNMDRWMMEEAHKLERQQKIQQQKLLELQQTLLKTEILKNQLQIATISQSAQSPNTSTSSPSLLGALAGGSSAGFNFTPSVTTSLANNGPSGGQKVALQKNAQTTTTSSTRSERVEASPEEDLPPGEKRKVHNLIEKKYRCSINDRICLLRDMVSNDNNRDHNKRLQKSAVLQKTIDHIRHLENQVKRLQEENQQLRETLAKVTGMHRLPSFSSPPDTPHQSISPQSQESAEDSGHPSSPDEYITTDDYYLTQRSSPHRKISLLASHLVQGTTPSSNVPRVLMCVLLVAIFFVNPLTFTEMTRNHGHQNGNMRSLSGIETTNEIEGAGLMMDSVIYYLFWCLRILIAALCFGWVTLRSMPKLSANSSDAVKFWRFRKQAENDLQKGEFVDARENLEVALAVISRPIPTSYYGIVTGLLWSLSSHLLFQLYIGRVAVSLASVVMKFKGEKGCTGKKSGFGVMFADASEAYHLLHQINMASTGGTHLHGMGFYLALNALNFAEADRPFRFMTEQQLSEMFLTLGLQCHFSLPYGSSLPMWFYFFCSRNRQFATPLKWTATPRGKKFLLSAQWEAEVKLGSKLYHGSAALPLYSVTRAYCKELLRDTFSTHLLPDVPSPTGSHDPTSVFKDVLNLAKEANSNLLHCLGSVKSLASDAHDSGFAVLQWWASVGLVACYWSAGEDQAAKDYYASIEGLSGDSAPVPTALHLAFKANRLYRRPTDSTQTPVNVLLQLCGVTSNALKMCVTDVLQDHSSSTENELHQLGLLLACDWLLDLRVRLWEGHGKEGGVTREISQGFYQDLDTLSQLVELLPPALSRLRLYKGCYQLIAGANPMQAQAMLSSTGRASLLRRRGQAKDSDSPALYSHEHTMAKFLAHKHLSPSLELSDSGDTTTGGKMRHQKMASTDSKQTHV